MRSSVRMHQGLLRAIHQRMSARPDDELLRLWVENDRFQYSAETFEAVRSILAGRGITPPPQDDPPAMAVRAASRRASDVPTGEAGGRSRRADVGCVDTAPHVGRRGAGGVE